MELGSNYLDLEDNLSSWREIVMEMYDSLPEKNKRASVKSMFLNISSDLYLYKCLGGAVATDKYANNVLRQLVSKKIDLEELRRKLEEYYNSNEKTCKIESELFDYYSQATVLPIFVLSYGRWDANGTLEMFERFNEKELFDAVTVFVDSAQRDKYAENHKKFGYFSATSSTVGERMLRVLDYCMKKKIRYATVMEDDIQTLNYLIKCGVEKCRCSNSEDKVYGVEMFKRIQQDAVCLLKKDPECVMVRIRNRTHCNTEDRSVYGHYDATLGGTPDLMWIFDVRRFIEIYLNIPEEHYKPQYDWAMLLECLRQKKNWYVISSVCKDERMSKSVIGVECDRMELANEMIRHYEVTDRCVGNRVRSKLNSVKLRVLRDKKGIKGYGK